MDSANLAALIGSRICHDLISPIGAITNGLELLEMTGHRQGPELDLIAQSVGNAGARIRFFRVAYGAASEQLLGKDTIRSILADNYGGGRLSIDWTPPGEHPRNQVRLALLALQCCEAAMPCGGKIAVRCAQEKWRVEAKSDKLSLDHAFWDGLNISGEAPTLKPSQVQFALLPMAVRDSGRILRIARGEGQIVLTF